MVKNDYKTNVFNLGLSRTGLMRCHWGDTRQNSRRPVSQMHSWSTLSGAGSPEKKNDDEVVHTKSVQFNECVLPRYLNLLDSETTNWSVTDKPAEMQHSWSIPRAHPGPAKRSGVRFSRTAPRSSNLTEVLRPRRQTDS